jgi:hypothetical protein
MRPTVGFDVADVEEGADGDLRFGEDSSTVLGELKTSSSRNLKFRMAKRCLSLSFL